MPILDSEASSEAKSATGSRFSWKFTRWIFSNKKAIYAYPVFHQNLLPPCYLFSVIFLTWSISFTTIYCKIKSWIQNQLITENRCINTKNITAGGFLKLQRGFLKMHPSGKNFGEKILQFTFPMLCLFKSLLKLYILQKIENMTIWLFHGKHPIKICHITIMQTATFFFGVRWMVSEDLFMFSYIKSSTWLWFLQFTKWISSD